MARIARSVCKRSKVPKARKKGEGRDFEVYENEFAEARIGDISKLTFEDLRTTDAGPYQAQFDELLIKHEAELRKRTKRSDPPKVCARSSKVPNARKKGEGRSFEVYETEFAEARIVDVSKVTFETLKNVDAGPDQALYDELLIKHEAELWKRTKRSNPRKV